MAKGQQEPAFDKAIFAAKKGKLVGPVKTQFGWYVFDVTKITEAKQQTLDESKASIKQILASQNQQNALKKFGDDYRNRYKKETDCREGLRRRTLQERAEEEGHDDHGADQHVGRGASADHRRRARTTAAP